MEGFRRLKLSYRFALLIGLFALGFLVYGGWSFKTLNELKVNGPVYQRIVQGKDLIADILPPPKYIIESYLVSLQLAAATDKAEQDALVERLKTLKREYDERHVFWLKESLDEHLAETFLKKAHVPAEEFYTVAFNELIPALQKNENEAAAPAMARMRALYETHRKAIDEVVQQTVSRNKVDETMAKERIAAASVALLLILGMSLGAATVVAALIVRGLLVELGGEPHYAAEITRKIAAGDLTMKIALKDGDTRSLLCAMKVMQETLAKTVSNIKTAVELVSTGSQQLASGNLDLSSRTAEEAGSLEESAASVEKLSHTVKENADNGLHANKLAESASQVAIRGGAVVSEVVQTMGAINESSKKIVDIISVIDGIAFQTNILALNAAVEAARAGEQGKGFAVVATEVRNLAQRSAMAAKEIKELISASVEKVDVGAKLVDQAGSTMDEIVASVKRVSNIINEITTASQEQSTGIDKISHTISIMEKATQQNAALVEQAAAATESLQEQAVGLAQLVSVFKVDSTQEGQAADAASMRLQVSKAPPQIAMASHSSLSRY